ncbi:MAG: hypothetical protein JEY94_13775 [Melioribacteraceae bacterium]|nr:hypothetical protein [Melioribacteraceae bacterium]
MAQNDNYLLFLIAQAKDGNKNKYLEFCELYYDEIFKIILQLIPSDELAGELTTEVFISAFDSLKYVQEDTPFTDWLKSIAIRNSLNLLKTLETEVDFSANIHNQEYLENSSSDFNDVLINFLRLSAKLRISYVLYYFDEYNENEVIELVAKLFDDKDENILKDAHEKLVANTNYQLITDPNLGWKAIENIEGELPENLAQIKELIDDLKDRFNIYFRSIDSSAEIISDIRAILLETSLQKADEEKAKRTKIREALISRAKKETKEKLTPKPEIIEEKKESVPKKPKLVPIIKWAAFFIALFFCYYVFVMPKSGDGWQIAETTGTIYSDGKPFTDNEIVESHKYSTDDDSQFELSKSDLGKIRLFENTSIIINENRYKKNSIKFIEGKLQITSLGKTFDRYDIIELPEGYIIDKGGNYIIEINKYGNGNLTIDDGYLIIKSENIETILTTESTLQIFNNKIGLPVHINSSEKLKLAVGSYDKSKNLNSVLFLLKKENIDLQGITIWNLFAGLENGKEREELFEMLKERFNLLDELKDFSSIKNNDENFRKLRDEIYWQLY